MFQVDIRAPGSRKFTRDGYIYVSLPEGTEYSIVLTNNNHSVCDAIVTLDGERIGGWKVDPYSSTVIERPGNIHRKFTFVSERGNIARQTGTIPGRQENGLLSVEFRPANICTACSRSVVYKQSNIPRATLRAAETPETSLTASRSGFKSGVTVLGRESDQEFDKALPLKDNEINWSLVTTVNIRLVVKEDYVSLRTNNIPPRIEDLY